MASMSIVPSESLKATFLRSPDSEPHLRQSLFHDLLTDPGIRSIDRYTGTDLLYLNPKGVIPTKAVVERGVRRANPFREKKRFIATSVPVGGPREENDGDDDDEEEQEGKLDKKALTDMEG